MPEILTESFCERCGTRYTFESAAPRASRLKGVKVLSRGLKNFVLSDDSTLDEAMAAARSDTDRELTAQQLDAFHQTFNFCMTCRQYTCPNCWNEVEGRCLSCAPNLGHEIMPAPFPDLDVAAALEAAAANGNGHGHDHAPASQAMQWPTMDMPADAMGETSPPEPPIEPTIEPTEPLAAEADQPDADPLDVIARPAALGGDAAPDVEAPAAPDAVIAAAEPTAAPGVDVAPESPAALTDIDIRAAAAAAATARLLRAFRPGESLDDALEAYEHDLETAARTAPEVAPPAEAEATDAEATPEIAATADVEPGVAPEPQAAPESQAAPEPAPRGDRVAQPTWQIVAPDGEPSDAPAAPPIAASAEPSWPARPEWPARQQSGGLPFLGRPAAPTGGIEALWAESAREVSTVPSGGPAVERPGAAPTATIAPCVSCGLSLSANARFCRRCGTRQG
ncbi:MAG: hypothetical protein ACLGIJ_04845 [Candidatus Limnocylindria bacterium]